MSSLVGRWSGGSAPEQDDGSRVEVVVVRRCSVDKVAREGIRVQELLDRKRFRARLATTLAEKNGVSPRSTGTKRSTNPR